MKTYDVMNIKLGESSATIKKYILYYLFGVKYPKMFFQAKDYWDL